MAVVRRVNDSSECKGDFLTRMEQYSMQQHHRQVALGVLRNACVLVVNDSPILVNWSDRHVFLVARGEGRDKERQ